jgi:hypothetical protein
MMQWTMPAVPPPGWYSDPAQPGWMRWWTGQGWSEHVAPPAMRDEVSAINVLVPTQQAYSWRALVWGIIAVVVPILPATIFAVLFGVMGLRRARRMSSYGLEPQGRGMSIAGIVLGGVSVVSGSLALVALLVLPALGR